MLFLIFWYIVLNSGREPQFDFAGWYGTAGNTVRFGYLAGAALIVAAAEVFNRVRIRRAW